MADLISFKQRVAETVSQYSADFKSVFVDYEYLVCSPAFVLNPYYIITADKDNYLHLTGVSYRDPNDFFNKCSTGTLTEADISFAKRGQAESAVKGSVRRKINVLPNLVRIFDSSLIVEESFSKNRVVCSFGASDNSCTVGFTLTSGNSLRVRPMTLLSGSELDRAKARDVELILRRKTGGSSFDTLLLGDTDMLLKYRTSLWELLSEQLKESITTD